MKQLNWRQGRTTSKAIWGQLWKFGYESQYVLYMEKKGCSKVKFLEWMNCIMIL